MGSLSLWRSVARHKEMEDARQQLSKRPEGTENPLECIVESSLNRAIGLPIMKNLQKEQMNDNLESQALIDDIGEVSTICSSEDEADALEPLLWVSELRFGGARSQFTLT